MLELVIVLIPVGDAERLKVIPCSAVLVTVLLGLPDAPDTAADEGCIGDDQVELAPETSLVDTVSVSLAGIRLDDVSEDAIVPEV